MSAQEDKTGPGGVAFVGCDGKTTPAAQGRRREVVVNGRRVKTVDIHAHCAIPEAKAMLGEEMEPALLMSTPADRIRAMDEQGIDVEALSINPFWYEADRDVARELITLQNEKLAEVCAAMPDRFVAFATVALQHPDLAVEQLVEGIKKFGLRGVSTGGSVNGMELADPKLHPFWAKVEQLGVLVFIHPQGTPELESSGRLDGNGVLTNTIGNPLETTIALSHLIFEGTLDQFPGLKICAAHGGGYLPSYLGRSEVACTVRANANCANKRKPSEYLKSQIMVDTMVFSDEGLRHLVAEVGVSQVVYGTDVPFNWPVTVDLVLNAKFLTDAEKVAILSGNLMKLLKIRE
jgi:aminocarboxymuconate-semialdehyde decarboxylase